MRWQARHEHPCDHDFLNRGNAQQELLRKYGDHAAVVKLPRAHTSLSQCGRQGCQPGGDVPRPCGVDER